MNKTCTKCKKKKSITEFYRNRRSKDGFDWRCKACAAEHGRNYYKANVRKVRKRCDDWARKNPEKRKEGQQRWLKEYRFTRALISSRHAAKHKDHLPCTATKEEIEAAFTGKCYVCQVPEIECSKQLCMDHNRKTGKFRGWLCQQCNAALGMLKDSPEIVMDLALYAKYHEIVIEQTS